MTNTPFLKRDLIAPVLAVLGIVLGATATYYFTRAQILEQQGLERARALEVQYLEIRKAAYTDFLKGQTLLWSDPKREKEANQLIVSAKLNILLTAPKGVVCAMASYWALDPEYRKCPDSDQRRRMDASIYQEMRRDFFKALDVHDDPDLDAAVIVPYIWLCSLGSSTLETACKPR